LTPVHVTVPLVPGAERETLSGFLRDYVAEMSAIIGTPLGNYPRFELYWTEPGRRWPHRIEMDSLPAGFALIRKNADLQCYEMGEFFIAAPFRRRGTGLAAARLVLTLYPGPWRITQREANTGAIAFWHGVLDGFVRYEEATTRTDAVRREQRFAVASPA
jgi:predicted acetyltransferase